MKKLILGLLTLSAIGAATLPVYADEATIQDAQQTVYQTGNDNYAGQSAVQQNRSSQRGYRDGDTGNVQTSDQLTDQYGSGNMSEQRIRQENARKSRGGDRNYCGFNCN